MITFKQVAIFGAVFAAIFSLTGFITNRAIEAVFPYKPYNLAESCKTLAELEETLKSARDKASE